MCRVALAPDRLASEFPPTEQTSAVPSTLTVQDVLRETSAGPGPGSSTPLDEQVKRFRKSFWDHDQEPDSRIIPPFKRIGRRWSPQLDAALGFGALAAVMLIVTGLLVRALWQGARGSHSETSALAQLSVPTVLGTALHDQAGLLNIGTHFKKPATKPLPQATVVPAAIPGWRLWNSPASKYSNDSRVAFYQRGKEVVELTLIRTPRQRFALRHPLEAYAASTRMVASPQGTKSIAPEDTQRYGRDCLLFDYSPQPASAAWRVVTFSPYLPTLPHTISWYAAPYVVTVGADSAQARDSFARAYLAAETK